MKSCARVCSSFPQNLSEMSYWVYKTFQDPEQEKLITVCVYLSTLQPTLLPRESICAEPAISDTPPPSHLPLL